jgi:cell pole-organizing protein PopZ
MAVAKSDPEPSMEEILASIRRIIAEEGSDEPEAEPAVEAEVVAVDDGVLDLTDVVEDIPDGAAARAEPETEPQAEAPDEPDEPAPVTESFERLVTGMAAAETSSQFSTLARAAEPDPLKGLRGGRTVEEICIDLLKPMLKEWLDANLPGVVERLVERELRYLSRRNETE